MSSITVYRQKASQAFFRCSCRAFSNRVRHYDLIGPPDSVSNLRKVVFAKKANETRREQGLRLQKQASYKWQHTFWTEHNESFNESKKKFLEERKNAENESDKQFADELSVFYKDFLDKNYSLHKTFLWEWYTKNFKLLWSSVAVIVNKATSK